MVNKESFIQYTTNNFTDSMEWGDCSLWKDLENDQFIHLKIMGKEFIADEINLYSNHNILICFHHHDHKKYQLIYHRSWSLIYDDISYEVYDQKYRKAFEQKGKTKLIYLLYEKRDDIIPIKAKNWKDILGVYDDVAIVNPYGNRYNLYKLNNNVEELKNSLDIVHVMDGLYKYKTQDSGGLFYLYNSKNRKSSSLDIGYEDIVYISEQIAMGVYRKRRDIIDVQSINKDSLIVLYSGFDVKSIGNDIIDFYIYNSNNVKERIQINFHGTLISEINIVQEFTNLCVHANDENNDMESIEINSSEHVTIKRIVIVNDNSVRLLNTENIITSGESLKIGTKNNYVCWILLEKNRIVIVENLYDRNNIRPIVICEGLPTDISGFTFRKKGRHIFKVDIESTIDSIVKNIADFLRLELKKKVKLSEKEQKLG